MRNVIKIFCFILIVLNFFVVNVVVYVFVWVMFCLLVLLVMWFSFLLKVFESFRDGYLKLNVFIVLFFLYLCMYEYFLFLLSLFIKSNVYIILKR